MQLPYLSFPLFEPELCLGHVQCMWMTELCCCACRSTEPLIATCVRHAKELLGVDLSACKEWLPVIEVHYQRPPTSMSPDAMESTEVCLFTVPRLEQDTVASQEAFHQKIEHKETKATALSYSPNADVTGCLVLQISVIFLANMRSAMPGDWQSLWKEQEAWLKGKAAHEQATVKKEEEVRDSAEMCSIE